MDDIGYWVGRGWKGVNGWYERGRWRWEREGKVGGQLGRPPSVDGEERGVVRAEEYAEGEEEDRWEQAEDEGFGWMYRGLR